MGINKKTGFALIEVVVAIIIATIVLSSASSTMPRILNQIQSPTKLNQAQDYIRIITDFRNASLDSSVSKDLFELNIDGDRVIYRNEELGLFREQGEIKEKLFFDSLSIERQSGLSGNEWKRIDNDSKKILFHNWWKLNMHHPTKTISGILKGK